MVVVDRLGSDTDEHEITKLNVHNYQMGFVTVSVVTSHLIASAEFTADLSVQMAWPAHSTLRSWVWKSLHAASSKPPAGRKQQQQPQQHPMATRTRRSCEGGQEQVGTGGRPHQREPIPPPRPNELIRAGKQRDRKKLATTTRPSGHYVSPWRILARFCTGGPSGSEPITWLQLGFRAPPRRSGLAIDL